MRTPLFIALLLATVTTAAVAQTTTQGNINAVLINKSGIAIQFVSDPSGVSLTGNGTSAATLGFGNISAYGVLSPGVSRPAVTGSNFTVRTPFDVNVIVGGIATTSYNLSAALSAAAPAGFTYIVDNVPLTTLTQTIQTNAAYSTNIVHNLDLTVSTAGPTAGGPAVGTVVSSTITFTAVAN
jgi:hypothetical protein